MSELVRVAVDAMGGDHAPEAVSINFAPIFKRSISW